jgi:hypothetical protein
MQDQIEVKNEAARSAIGKRYELTFEQFSIIPELTGDAIPQLHDYLAGIGIEPSGPHIYEYHFHDSPHGPRRIRGGRFMLTVAVPVAEPIEPMPPIEFITLRAFKYIELLISSFGDKWREIRDLAEQSGYKRSLIEREVYHSWQGSGNSGTRVSLQVGIK